MCRFRFNRHLLVFCLAVAATTSWAQNFPPAARITITNSEVFIADSVVFFGTNSVDPDNGPQPLSYEWDFSDGSTSRQSNPSHAFDAPGAYRVSLTVSDGADSDVALATVFVLARPAAGKPSKSSPIAFSLDEQQLWVVNPDSDTVTLFDIVTTNPVKVAEIPVGKQPRTIALSLDGR